MVRKFVALIVASGSVIADRAALLHAQITLRHWAGNNFYRTGKARFEQRNANGLGIGARK
jgi:hypothetical protein